MTWLDLKIGIVSALDLLNVSREKQEIALNIGIYDQHFKLSGLLTTQIFYIQLCKERRKARWYNGPYINSYLLEDTFPAKTTKKTLKPYTFVS